MTIISNEEYFYGLVQPTIEINEENRKRILEEFPIPKKNNQQKVSFITDFKNNEEVPFILALVNKVEEKTTNSGNPYLEIEFANNRGKFKGKRWHDSKYEEAKNFFETNNVVYLSGKANEFPLGSGKMSLNIDKHLAAKDVLPSDLLPNTDEIVENMVVELVSYLEELTEPHRTIALSVLKEYWEHFRVTAAAKGHHHAYVSGLLTHTLGLMRLARFITHSSSPTKRMAQIIEVIHKQHLYDMNMELTSEKPSDYKWLVWSNFSHLYEVMYNFGKLQQNKEYPYELNKDMLITAILFHDIGKIYEYSYVGEKEGKFKHLYPFIRDAGNMDKYPSNQGTFDMDPLGVMQGHMPIGYYIFIETIRKYDLGHLIDLKDFNEYLHCILSHHYKQEWGSTVTPQTPNAYLICFVDYLDANWEKHRLKIKEQKENN